MRTQQLLLAFGSLAAGFLGAVLAAPSFHHHDEPAALAAMWANRYDSLQEMTEDADGIVLGRVVQTVPGRTVTFEDGRPPLPFTFVDVEVSRVLLGEAPSHVTVEQTGGGFLGKEIYVEDGGGRYLVGEEVLLFLKDQAETGLHIVPHPAGRFTVVDGSLRATLPRHPAAQALDGRDLATAERMLRD